ncbi:aspartate ammonia-lyase [Orenia metallireducens]|jgi:hypothetical protein|uniref:Aspartate ammonia-lyase n=1 Tax=Orenia metallireducens TaxID=1413210 RepID=A0A1C0ADF6_9FIRM|nr:hypothetical protein [Orenia metallireducens]OCL28658.1 aspartate ammonia-lyase [Orenia metallireducens]
MARIHSIETRLEERRKRDISEQVPFRLDGQTYYAEKNIVAGEMETLALGAPIGEMMTSETARQELLEKIVLDVELGREQVPTLYGPIYDTLEDSNFPKEFEAKWAQHGSVIFFEHMEGEEVKFGSLNAESGPIAKIKGYAAGFEYTKEMELFNQTFNLEIINKAFGEGHNAILNHLHLAPIFQFNYQAANKTAPVYVDEKGKVLASSTGAHFYLSMRQTLKQGLTDSRKAGRPGTILLANSANKEDIEDGMSAMNIQATPYKAVSGISDIIYYDGWEVNVGKRTIAYPGVPEGKAYLIRPKRGFKELIKQRLVVDSTMGDKTRLVESQIVGDFWRGVFAAVEENVQEITLPGQS